MKPFFKQTEIRWSDLDANKHLANSSYMKFTGFARIALLRERGITLDKLGEWDIGPAILYENFSFFKEAKDGEQIYISVINDGVSKKGEIFTFKHDLYKEDGTHICSSEAFGVWFSMSNRKIKIPPQELIDLLFKEVDRSKLRQLSLRDLKDLPHRSHNIDPKIFKEI